MTMLEAARMGDRVAHSHALFGFIAGLVAGVILGALIAAATVVTGGGALLLIGSVLVASGAFLGTAGAFALFGAKLGATFEGEGDPIGSGSGTVFIGRDRRNAARATLDFVTCDAPQKIAQGSLTVFVDGGPAARRTDKAECGGTITEGWATVFIGKEAGTYLPVEEELPSWMVATAEWAVRIGGYLTLAGTAVLSGILVAGVGYFVGDWASTHGKDWLGAAGERLFGERGRIVGEFVGEQGASFLAGKALGKVEGHLMTVEAAGARRVLASNPELAARLATTRGANPLQIAARQNVAAEHYRSTTSYAEFERGYRARPGKEGATDAQVQRAYGREINSHLAGIDFRQPVHVETIPAETKLYTYNTPGAEHAGSYFTREPTPPTKIGISENKTYSVDGQSVTAPRELYTVTTKSDVQALVSTAAPKLDNWSVKTFDAEGNATPVVAESKGGAEQININTARNPENGPTQGDVFADGQQGVLTSTGQTSRDYADASTNQASDLSAPKEYKWAPIAGDSAIIGKGTTPLGGDGSGDGGAP